MTFYFFKTKSKTRKQTRNPTWPHHGGTCHAHVSIVTACRPNNPVSCVFIFVIIYFLFIIWTFAQCGRKKNKCPNNKKEIESIFTVFSLARFYRAQRPPISE